MGRPSVKKTCICICIWADTEHSDLGELDAILLHWPDDHNKIVASLARDDLNNEQGGSLPGSGINHHHRSWEALGCQVGDCYDDADGGADDDDDDDADDTDDADDADDAKTTPMQW